MDVRDRKIQHGSTTDPQPLRWPTPEAVARHVGRAWVTDSPEERGEALAGAPEIPPSQVLRYMETDIYLQGTPTAPRTLPKVRAAIRKQRRPRRLSPDAAMMVLMVKLPSKLLPLASVYRPTAQVHAANDTVMVRGYKPMTGTPRPGTDIHIETRPRLTIGGEYYVPCVVQEWGVLRARLGLGLGHDEDRGAARCHMQGLCQ